MLSDFRYALRGFRKNPTFTAIAVLSLALGIGANTAIFSLMDRVMLRSLPVRNAGELVLLTANGPRRGMVETNYDDTYTFSYPMYRDFRDRGPAFAGVLAWYPARASLSLRGRTELVVTNLVTGNYFGVLGVGTVLGRPIAPEDARVPGASPVAVLSHSFWVQRFAGDPAVLNQTMMLNGQPMTLVGVAAPSFHGLAVGEEPAIFVPLTMYSLVLPGRKGFDMEERRAHWLNVVARLKPGVTLAAAESGMNGFWKPILQNELQLFSRTTPTFRQAFVSRHLSVTSAANGISVLRMTFGSPLTLLMVLVALVLLIACANVANLLVARAAGRQKEIAIRLAIGASRAGIVRQILVESLTLALAGGALGVLLAMWSGTLLLRLLPLDGTATAISSDPDLRILAFTTAISIACGILFGLVPALQATRPKIVPTLKDQGDAILAGGSHVRYRKVLVVAQVALSLLLLIGAGLFMQSLRNIRKLSPGFRTDHLLSFAVNPTLNGYDTTRAIALFDRLEERVGALPGVRSAAMTSTPILAGENWDSSITVPGREPLENEFAPNVDTVSPGYFTALGATLLMGRDFTAADSAQAPRVAIVNQTFAQYYFGNGSPLGRTFYFTGDAAKTPVAIVGVARDGKYADLRESKQRFAFCPYGQRYTAGPMTFYVRTAQGPDTLASAVRQAVREADANLPLFDMKTMEQQIDESVSSERIVSALSGVFGLLATLLAAIGLYGVMSFSVARRTREIGIRMALGAGRGSVLWLVLSEVAMLVGLGVAIAVPASFPLTKLARSMLYNVGPHDPWVLAGGAGVLITVALLAGYLPAARATRVDPLTALRHE
jgi:predicted permease